ncbi:hypothetical protein [uncultured Ruminococcus sp.]|uniref:hypothetical protein n=1 Tax=uncultured Ruminococcus sp. TaxID=165186 RepID=UPI0025D9270E|nr:hypothetical protein [uncultured Ruminococcus sp.]
MKISVSRFEEELNSLINAALSASSIETAKGYLKQADNKINAYDNIPYSLQETYRRKILDAERKLGL